MGNRFSTVPQYHRLVTGHGVLATIVFLFLVPAAIMHARFHTPPPGARPSRRIHIYLQALSVLLLTVVFVLGWFAVGPNRSWTNPHHVIGLTIYVMFLLQAVGGMLVKSIRKKSLRLMIHRWHGRAIALLGFAQVPLGLALYGSPKVTFILYAIWMAFLFVTYFVLSWRHETYREDYMIHGGRSEATWTTSDATSKHKSGWIGPLALGAAALTLFRRHNKNKERDRSRSRSRSMSRSRRGPPEVVSSRRDSPSGYLDEKYSERTDDRKGGGLVNKFLGLAAVLGAGGLAKNMKDRREKRRYGDEEYSAVATDTTPSRPRRLHRDDYTDSELSEDRTALGGKGRASMVSGPGGRSAAAAALSAAESRTTRPVTPPAARPAQSRVTSYLPSDYFEDYDSPSRRVEKEEESGGAGKGILGGLGLGWFANKFKGKNDKKAEEERLRLEDERRDGRHGSRYTGDGYGTPSRRPARRATAPSESVMTRTTFTEETGSSQLEARPPGASHSGPPMPPLGADNLPPPPMGGPQRRRDSRSRSRSRSQPGNGPVDMPAMPPDPAGLFSSLNPPQSATESYMSASAGRPQPRRQNSHRYQDGERAAAAAAATAHSLAQEQEEERRRAQSRAPPGSQPVSVKVKYHDDRGNVTLRRLTDEEAAAARQDRQRRSNSVSSLSGSETTPGRRRRYRRSSTSSRRGGSEDAGTAEPPSPSALSPPAPSFAGRRQKDSAYYSGQPGPSGGGGGGGSGGGYPAAAQTVSSIGSPESHGTHGTWSALSPTPSSPVTNRAGSVAASAADRRRRRRSERQNARPVGTMEFN